jgi:hypothetical protein
LMPDAADAVPRNGRQLPTSGLTTAHEHRIGLPSGQTVRSPDQRRAYLCSHGVDGSLR